MRVWDVCERGRFAELREMRSGAVCPARWRLVVRELRGGALLLRVSVEL